MPKHDLSSFDDMVIFKNEPGVDPPEFSMDPRWSTYQYLKAENLRMDSEDSADEVPDYSTWTNDELRTELITRKLSVEGKKIDLVQRLDQDDEEYAKAHPEK